MSLFARRTKKEKLWDEVQKHVKKENWDLVKETLKKLVEIDPKDQRAQLKLAEVYLKTGDKELAIVHFLFAADEYGKDGFYPKAIAVLKQVLELDNTRLDVRENMAKFYDKLKLPKDAEALRAFCQNADAAKEKEVLDFIKGKYEATWKGDIRACEFLKNLEQMMDARIITTKPKIKKKSSSKRKK